MDYTIPPSVESLTINGPIGNTSYQINLFGSVSSIELYGNVILNCKGNVSYLIPNSTSTIRNALTCNQVELYGVLNVGQSSGNIFSGTLITEQIYAFGGNINIENGSLTCNQILNACRIQISNKGTFTLQTSSTFGGTLAGSGTFEVSSGTITASNVNFGKDFSGTAKIANGGTLTLNKSTFNGTLSGSGIFEVGSGTVTVSNADFGKDFFGSVNLQTNTILNISNPLSLNTLTGNGLVDLNYKSLTIQPSSPSSFSGDFQHGGEVLIGGSAPWTWTGNSKLFDGTFYIKEGAEAILDSLESPLFTLEMEEGATLSLQGTNTIKNLSNQGTTQLIPSSVTSISLSEDTTYSGHLSGSGQLSFSSSSTTTWSWAGSPDFSGDLLFDANTIFNYIGPKEDVPPFTVNGKKIGDFDLSDSPLNITPKNMSHYWRNILGPGDLYIDIGSENTFTLKGQASGGNIGIHCQSGMVYASSTASLPGVSLSFENGGPFFISHQQNLNGMQNVQTVNSPGTLVFQTESPVQMPANLQVLNPITIQINSSIVTWVGSLSGTNTILKTGPGNLTWAGTELEARTWVVQAGTLESAGKFNTGSSIELQNDTQLQLTANQTLDGLTGSFNTTLNLQGSTLTLTGTSNFSGSWSCDSSSRVVVVGSFTVTPPENMRLPLTVNGTVTLSGQSPTLVNLSGTGSITTSVATTLENTLASTFSGTWSSSENVIKTGSEALTLTGNWTNHSGNFILQDGTLALDNTAQMGTPNLTILEGIFTPTATQNLTNTLTLADGTVRTNTAGLSLACTSVITGTPTFDVMQDLTFSKNASFGSSASFIKTGTGTLNLSGTTTRSGMLITVSQGTWRGTLQLDPTTLTAPRVFLASEGIFEPTTNQLLSSLTGQGQVRINRSNAVTLTDSTTFQGTLAGSGILQINSGTFTASNTSFGTNFTGSVDLASGTALDSAGNISLSTLSGSGTLQASNLTLQNTGSGGFEGTVTGTDSVTINGTSTFTKAQEWSALTVNNNATATFPGGLTVTTATVNDGGHLNLPKDSTINNLLGTGTVNMGSTLMASSTNFTGDFEGCGTVKTNGFNWNLNGQSDFTGTLQANSGTLALANTCILNPAVSVETVSEAILSMASPQTISSLTGNGTVKLNGQTLTLNLTEKRIYRGDFSGSGQVIVGGSTEWIWTGGTKTFTGTVLVKGGTKAVLDELGITKFTVACEASTYVYLPTPTTLKVGQTVSGTLATFRADAPLTLVCAAASNIFYGRVETDAALTFKGSIDWRQGTTTTKNLSLEAGAQATVCDLLNAATRVNLAAGSQLTFTQNQTLASMTGMGTLNGSSNRLEIHLENDGIFEGMLRNLKQLTVSGQGKAFELRQMETVETLTVQDATLVWKVANTALPTLELPTVDSLFLLETDCVVQTLRGEGRVDGQGHTFTLQGATVDFHGDITNASLLLTQGTKLTLSTGPTLSATKLWTESITLRDNSTFTKQAGTHMDPRANFEVAPGSTLALRGETTVAQISGQGTVAFDDLTLQPRQNITLEAAIYGTSPLHFRGTSDQPTTIQWTGGADGFKGPVECIGTSLELLDACHPETLEWYFSNATFTPHSDHVKEEATWVFANDNVLQTEALTLTQTLALQAGSHLTLKHSGPVTLSGALKGNATFVKKGSTSLDFVGPLDWTGCLDIQEGSVHFAETATTYTRFALNIHSGTTVTSDRNLQLCSLQGGGELQFQPGHQVTLRLSGNEVVETSLTADSLAIEGEGPAAATLTGQHHLNALSVDASASVSFTKENALNDGTASPDVHIAGKVSLLTETIHHLQLSGELECTNALAIVGRQAEAIVQGTLVTPQLDFDAPDSSLQLLSELDAQKLFIRQGEVTSSNALLDVESVILETNGSLKAWGEMQHLQWSGLLSPQKQEEVGWLPSPLSLEDAFIESGARLEVSLSEDLFSSLVVRNTVEGLQNLKITLKSDLAPLRTLTQTALPLLTLPPEQTILASQLPTLDEQQGVATLFKKPSEILKISATNHSVVLQINPFSEDDLR